MVFPSLYEGLGIVGIEAQAAGLKIVCSDRIPSIARITNGVVAISLQETPQKWAEIINRFSEGYVRQNTYNDIKNAGFDVRSLAKDLEQHYLQSCASVEEKR